MLHPYKHEMLHKVEHERRIKAAEQERLLQTISHPATHVQAMVVLSGLVSRWWVTRWQQTSERATEGTVVTP
ncbi:MAG: hypothetical protein LCI00_00670 [Chloroflexi bacterium]|nr:hypothetical protein [Chloroflexota bacterium]MCC6896943.1 hypothetical protein [Anaerolineae bacterium]